MRPGQGWERLEDEQGIETVRHTTPLYFDECTDGETRKILRRMGFCLVPLQRGRGDTEWLQQAGQEDWTVITTDERVIHVPEEKQAILDHKVRCFVLSPPPAGPWATLRLFVAMWDKVRSESAFPGPAIWLLHDESHPSMWQQVHPPAPGAESVGIDFSRTPAGHLLNLFTDVVTQHDKGWFGEGFVNALHDAIRVELESRLPLRPRSHVRTDASWEQLHSGRLSGEAGEKTTVGLDNPIDLAERRVMILEFSPDNGPHYQWILPSHKIRSTTSDDFDPHRSFVFNFGPTGFRRSGFGLPNPEDD